MKKYKHYIYNKFIRLKVVPLVLVFALFTIFILKASSVDAQESKVKLFCKLSSPEKCWVFLHPFIAGRALKITQFSREVTLAVKGEVILDTVNDGGQLDAFRHTYWMASLSQNFGWRKAERLGEAHEKGNYLSFRKGRLEDGSLPDSAASVMDRFNNSLGLNLSKQQIGISQDSLKMLVIAAILDGQAMMLSRNKTGMYLDCEGNVLNMNDYKRQWNIPKCLVPSNTIIK